LVATETFVHHVHKRFYPLGTVVLSLSA